MHRVVLRRFFIAVMFVALIAPLGCHAHSPGSTADAAPPKAHHARNHAASQVRPPSEVPAHVQTAEYLWTPAERAADKQIYAPHVTWAYAVWNQYGATRAAGIKTVLYTNPLMPYHTEQFEYGEVTKNPDLQAKDCGGNTVTAYAGASRLLDVRNPRAASAVRNVATGYAQMLQRVNRVPRAPIDVMFVDNANEFYGVDPMPCNFDPTQWTQAVDSALGQTGFPIVLNTLDVAPSVVPSKVAALRGKNIVGLMYEHCFADRQWTAEEIAQILTVQTLRRLHKPPGPGFWCYVNGPRGIGLASSVIPQRLFNYASFLLTYDPAYSVYQTAYDSPPSTFKVLPETQFVPLDPVSAVTDTAQLQTAGGAYVRQFHYCYYQKHLLGSCEVAVNPATGTAQIPNLAQYRHSASLSGNGVLDGGTMSFGQPAVGVLNAGTAAILVP